MNDSITIVIPWSNRPEISRSLSENLSFIENQHVNYTLLIVNYGGDQNELSAVLAQLSSNTIEIINVQQPVFNKSAALNFGIHHCKSTYFMCLDADVILKDFDFKQAFDTLKNDYFITIKTVQEDAMHADELPNLNFELEGITTFSYQIVFEHSDGRTFTIALNKTNLANQTRSAPGILLTSKRALIEIGGYNSELKGWGWEDIDLIARLQFSGKERVEMGTVLHLTHSDEFRNIDGTVASKSENENENFQKCIINYQLGLVNGTLLTDLY